MAKRMWHLAGLALVMGSFAGCPKQPTTVGFEARTPPAEQVAKVLQDDTRALEGFQTNESDRVLIDLFRRVNTLTVTPGSLDPHLKSALDKIKKAASDYLKKHGKDRATHLGLFLLGQFEQRLKTLSEESNRFPGAVDSMFMGVPPTKGLKKAYDSFTQAGGAFLKLAVVNGLVRSNKKGGLAVVEADRFFIRLSFKVYWANLFAQRQEPTDWMWSEMEQKWYDIWLAERSRTTPLDRKMAAIARLVERDSAYPAHKARGIIYMRTGQRDKAVKAFQSHLKNHPSDGQARAFLDKAKQSARKGK